ncbi:MAG: GNAT family protein [Acidimicrobiales bacterium]
MSDSIHLRPVSEGQLSRLLELLTGDPSDTGEFQWFGFRMALAKELERRWPEDGLIHAEKPSFLAVTLEDGSCVGWVTWRPVGPAPVGTFEVGIALFREHRGQGLGTEAQRQLVDYLFTTTPVHRLQAGTELDNVVEQRALERIGFLREGVARGLYFRAGQWRDSVLYGLLRPERGQS